MDYKESCRNCGKQTSTLNNGYCSRECEGEREESLRFISDDAPTEKDYLHSLPTFEDVQSGGASTYFKNELHTLAEKRKSRAKAMEDVIKNLQK